MIISFIFKPRKGESIYSSSIELSRAASKAALCFWTMACISVFKCPTAQRLFVFIENPIMIIDLRAYCSPYESRCRLTSRTHCAASFRNIFFPVVQSLPWRILPLSFPNHLHFVGFPVRGPCSLELLYQKYITGLN